MGGGGGGCSCDAGERRAGSFGALAWLSGLMAVAAARRRRARG